MYGTRKCYYYTFNWINYIHFNKVFLVVLGSPIAATHPTNKTEAVNKIGTLGFVLMKKPNRFVPTIAPILAISRKIPVAVDRR